MKITDFQNMKKEGKKISMVTCYDYWTAKIVSQSEIDCILVGDTAAMIMHGHTTTIPATIPLIIEHVKAVAKGIGNKFIVADMPFMSYRKGMLEALEGMEQLIRAGAHAIKLEGVDGNLEIIHHAVSSGIPIMAHLGLTPQSIHQLGGMRIQAKQDEAAQKLINDALAAEQSGAFALVLECVPAVLARTITTRLNIPTIGIGAGASVDGQILVLQDLLGVDPNFKPKFLKQYLNGFELIQNALNNYNNEVKAATFPALENCY